MPVFQRKKRDSGKASVKSPAKALPGSKKKRAAKVAPIKGYK